MPDFESEREEMVELQLKRRGITDENVLDAMAEVPREYFVKEEMKEFAYDDSALPIAADQTISQPYIVALMVQELEPEASDVILDIGTGSGYAAAVVSRIVEQVYSIERIEKLANRASETISKLGYDNIHIKHGDGTKGWPEHAPFDGIMVAAGGPVVPETLKDQLAGGGHFIIPVGEVTSSQKLKKFTKDEEGNIHEGDLGRVRFVPLIGEEMPKEEQEEKEPGSYDSIQVLADEHAEPFSDIESASIDPLINRIKDAKVVLMGEATHGTAEFYDMRARISKELIENHGFNIITAEADWPDAEHINYQIRKKGTKPVTAEPFTRFPTWMWENQQFMNFVEWMKDYNEEQTGVEEEVGFYGLDLYSLYSSIESVLDYLDEVDPELAEEARVRYGCLSPWEGDPQQYGAATSSGRYPDCEGDVVEMLTDLLEKRMEYISADGDRYHNMIQNAQVVKDAEEYYRSMYYGSTNSWNVRDQHMFDSLKNLLEFRGADAKAIVWAHNSHVGDARASSFSAGGRHNIGQLCRQEWGDEVRLIGFGTDHGTVAAADNWGGSVKMKELNSSLERSFEKEFHETGIDNFVLPLRKDHSKAVYKTLEKPRRQRAVGVIYRPETELASHYFEASLSRQFDEYIWFDSTAAVDPIEHKEEEKVPETYPFGV